MTAIGQELPAEARRAIVSNAAVTAIGDAVSLRLSGRCQDIADICAVSQHWFAVYSPPMKLLIILLAVWLGIASATEPQRNLGIAPASAEKRVALVIGNAAYKSGPLMNPVNDARAIANRLRSLGFDIVLRENLKQREIGGVYREFRSKITPGGVALVFYAGHGVQFKGQNYFPATDADISSEEDVPLQSLNLGNLLDNMEEAKAGVSLVFLDACRDNPFARRFRSASRGLAKVEAASGTLIHYATRPGSVASDGEGKNGTYTEALLGQMSEPDVPVELMLKRVANNVVAKTRGKQEPWVEGSLRGDFYFRSVAGATSSAASQLAVPVDLTAVEILFWESIKNSSDAEDFQAYLDKYPNGQFISLAERRIKKKPENEAAADGLEWAESDNGSDINWNEATAYCASKGSGWRLPSVAELAHSYKMGQPTPCGGYPCKVASKSRLSGPIFWSNEPNGSSEAWYVLLDTGVQHANPMKDRTERRALCARRP